MENVINRALVAKKNVMMALMALSMMCAGFSSCENGELYTADPATQPIAGKTYRENTATGDGYVQLTFHLNYKCTLVAKKDGEAAVPPNSNFEWYMSPNEPGVVVRYAQGAYNTETGEILSGKVFLSGTYDAESKIVTLTGGFDGKEATYYMKEVK